MTVDDSPSSTQDAASGPVPGPVRVAIACQGGGAQTAFTAGALSCLLSACRDDDAPFQVTALSGTSGGALCAAMAWRDLLLPPEDPPMVERYWKTAYPRGNAALDFPACLAEDWARLLSDGHLPGQNTAAWARNASAALMKDTLEAGWALAPMQVEVGLKPAYWHQAFALIDASPLGAMANLLAAGARAGLDQAKEMPLPGARQAAVMMGELLDLGPLHSDSIAHPGQTPLGRRDFDVQTAFRAVIDQYLTPDTRTAMADRIAALRAEGRLAPEILIGATDAKRAHDPETGPPAAGDPAVPETNFRVFRGSEHLDRLVDCLIASAAVPEVMRGIDWDGALLWDGLYSSNPPIYDLPDIHSAMDRTGQDPQEIWVIRINPVDRHGDLTSPDAISDRRNELSGNLPLHQEIRHVMKMAGLVRPDGSNHPRTYDPVGFGFIDMSPGIAQGLDLSSKLDTSARQAEALFEDGAAQMQAFLDRWKAARAA